MRRALGAVLAAAMLGCRAPAPGGFTLLFLGRSPAARLDGLALSWAPDPDHSRILAFDERLHVVRRVSSPRLATPMAVAPLGPGELLVTERTGEGVVLDTAGRPLREWDSPDVASLYAAAGRGRGREGRVVAVRSPYYVPQLASPEPDTAPLIRVLDTLGRPVAGLATIRRPAVPLLSHLVNAGAVAVAPDGSVYFAPLVRDEIRKYGRGGELRWTAQRGLTGTGGDPVFLPPPRGSTELQLRSRLVNVALVLGPDGRLYALGSDDSSATRLRLDVVDTATGAIVATRHLGAREGAVALDARGGLALLDADSLVGATPPAAGEREPFTPGFALPDLDGDTLTPATFRGKVTLVNFWASWCDPCREEFPHMAALYHEFDGKDFAIAAISDDVDAGKMRAFVRQFRPPFPILVGGGRMKQTYHYRGLPYSVLLDRHGRVIERIFGFGGEEEFRDLHATIAKEVGAP
ncbi:MAG TPA: TlpA disulfide reductase family protein [Gemmatimonadales bacterium]|nr:TlpA disulfide reductase family protein [Gemmatimonadales bacterium]